MLYRQAGMMMRQSVFHCTSQILETDVVEEVWELNSVHLVVDPVLQG